MDTTRAITYRDFTLNTEGLDETLVGGGGDGSGVAGCSVDSVQWADVDVVQWLEKKSQADGSDAGDVFQGVRRIRMAGTLYARTKLQLWDDIWSLRAALNPVLAQREEPLDKGYRPLYFSVPTNRADDYPSGAIDLFVRALPRGIVHDHGRDSMGGEDINPLAMPWQATFLCKDPGIYGVTPVTVEFDGFNPVTSGTSIGTNNLFNDTAHGLVAGNRVTFYAAAGGGAGLSLTTTYYVIASGLTANAFKVSATSGGTELDITTAYTTFSYVKSNTYAGTWTNRGTYLSALEAVVTVGQGAGTIVATVGDSVFTVTVPASTGDRIIRIKGNDRLITFEEDAVEDLYMSRITFAGDTTWPLIETGDTPYSITFHGMAGLNAGGYMRFYEQYA